MQSEALMLQKAELAEYDMTDVTNRSHAIPVKRVTLGAKDCTPEIDTSEIIVDFQWHFPMICQWHFPTEFRCSVVFSKGLSLSQWILTGIVQWIFTGIVQWISFCDFWRAIFCPEPGRLESCRPSRGNVPGHWSTAASYE